MGDSQKHAKSRNVFERFQTFWMKTFYSTFSVYVRCKQSLVDKLLVIDFRSDLGSNDKLLFLKAVTLRLDILQVEKWNTEVRWYRRWCRTN